MTLNYFYFVHSKLESVKEREGGRKGEREGGGTEGVWEEKRRGTKQREGCREREGKQKERQRQRETKRDREIEREKLPSLITYLLLCGVLHFLLTL